MVGKNEKKADQGGNRGRLDEIHVLPWLIRGIFGSFLHNVLKSLSVPTSRPISVS